jgi:DNA topoisomerase-1
LGKRGSFIGCTAYPECDYTRSTTGEIDPADARRELGNDPLTNLPVLLLRGPYGYYVQLGEVVEGEKKKPRRMSWPKEVLPENADLAAALKLLELPKELGNHPESGKKVIVNIGRFGPYIGHDGKFKSIPKTDSVFTIELDRAVALLAEARTSNTVLRELGEHPEDKKSVDVCNGRYGPYVRHGKVNATLPKDVTPEEVTLEEALLLIAARIAKGPVSKKKTVTKKAVPAKKLSSKNIKLADDKEEVAVKPKQKKSALVKKPASKKTATTKKKSVVKK